MINFRICNMKMAFVVTAIVLTLSLIALGVGTGEANAQDFPAEQSPADNSIDDAQTVGVGGGGDVNPDSASENSGPNYEPNDVLIYYNESQSSVLVSEDETGTADLSAIETTYLENGLAVVSEDLVSLGVDTTDIEIFGGDVELNGYYVRYDGNIDPLQLSYQLNAIEGVNWAQPNYIYEFRGTPPRDECGATCTDDWWIEHIKLDVLSMKMVCGTVAIVGLERDFCGFHNVPIAAVWDGISPPTLQG